VELRSPDRFAQHQAVVDIGTLLSSSGVVMTFVDAGAASTGRAPVPELSVVMPCLNEAETIAACVREARAFIREHGLDGEVVVADNGSTDGSQDIAVREGARVIAVPERGYGAALRDGILAARGHLVIMGDSDQSYDFSRMMPVLHELRGGAELVMGNRFRGGIEPGAMPWKNRYIGNPVLSGLGRLLFGCSARDFHCGLRGVRRDAFERMDLRTTGMEFASEMVIKATILGMRVTEVPTTLRPDGRSRPPHLRPWRDGWRHLRFMLLYSPDWLFLYPGLLLMLAGLSVGGWLVSGPRHIRGVELDVHTLLYASLATILGFQAVSFAVFARAFASAEGLLPATGWHTRLLRIVSLEVGATAGLLLLLFGLGGSIYEVVGWKEKGFGPLDVGRTLRGVIPSVLAMVLGLQMAMSSFLISFVGLGVRRLAEQETHGRPPAP
jgi:glycosyltransferase involved in cell wall biosynthesis